MSKHHFILIFITINMISGALIPVSLLASPMTESMLFSVKSDMFQDGSETFKDLVKKSDTNVDMILTGSTVLNGFQALSENQTEWFYSVSSGEQMPVVVRYFDEADQLNCILFTSGSKPESFGFIDVSEGFSCSGMDLSAAKPVPEPGTLFLFGSGLLGLGGYARKNRKNDATR